MLKNTNKNAAIQELEMELLILDTSGAPVLNEVLQTVVAALNQHIRDSGLSSHEILFQRDQHTGAQRNHSPILLYNSKGGSYQLKPKLKLEI